ncbi:MAG: hypothetical protein OXH13_00455 [Chloroflexi bacterium]|nr:hypothetical protein [Chloroflexota bacterium]MCY3695890.1 hypothetical protein [Chloroflexota bacterium]
MVVPNSRGVAESLPRWALAAIALPLECRVLRRTTAYLLDLGTRKTLLVFRMPPLKIVGYTTVNDLVPSLQVVLEGISLSHPLLLYLIHMSLSGYCGFVKGVTVDAPRLY